ncbi:MAG: hypothetical protein GYA41_07130 [Bacteroidales bacterium]|nr:hypothetical protein [Bacteroidales bacterium]
MNKSVCLIIVFLPLSLVLSGQGSSKSNEAPVADSLKIGHFSKHEPVILDKGTSCSAIVYVSNRDMDKLTFKWEIRPEEVFDSRAGDGEMVPEPVSGLINGEGDSISFMAPLRSGAYRLFVYVYDGRGHFSTIDLPFFVPPDLKGASDLGRYTSRTLNLLNSSTPERKNHVKILVYGQSISEQEWWLAVKKHVEEKFPYADIDMRNLAIGGFAAQYLYKTTEMDVSTFYPDLVLLHIYGDPVYYDSVLYTIRSRTAAEVAIMTDHYTGPNKWSDTMSYHLLPSMADRYSCEIINIRDSWKDFLEESRLEPSALLSDQVHLNRYGNLVMSELVKQVFQYKPEFPPDPFSLSKTYILGEDLVFRGKTFTMPFYGNRVVIKTEMATDENTDSLEVLVDGLPPSSFPGIYFMSRPANPDGRSWPWLLPAMVRIRHSVPWIREKWKCTFHDPEPPYNNFSFSITGSVTGDDGGGNSQEDFKSVSGRAIIKGGDLESGGDWHLNRSFKVLKTTVVDNDFVTWKTFYIGRDYVSTGLANDNNGESGQVLFQGIPNTDHVLKLRKTGKKVPVIKEITVYRPMIYN